MSFRDLPLVALRAFEAAARHRSYSKAAGELGLSHGAVSHHLKNLEQMLGVSLFRREGHRMLLTEHGQRLAVHSTEGLTHLARGFEEVRTRQRLSRTVSISVLPAFASRWLIQRIQTFQDTQLDIEVSMKASPLLVDFTRDDIDLGLRYGSGRWPGVTSVLLFKEVLFPVCSPTFAELDRLRALKDLKRVKLLHDQRIPWSAWLRRLGRSDVNLQAKGPIYSDAGHLLQAAVAGHGVALGRSVLAECDLATGALLRPLPDVAPAESSYYVVYSSDRPLRRTAAVFRDWLLAEAQQSDSQDS